MIYVEFHFLLIKTNQRKYYQENNQAEVIKRKNPQNSFQKEIAEVIWRVNCTY